MKISDIIYREEYILCEINEDSEFKRLITVADEVCDEDILIIPNSEKMPKFENKNHLPKAVICDINAILPENIPAIRVNNPRLAMSLAFYRYERPRLENIKIIGITGTNGKTSTATMINNVLSEIGYKTGFIGTGKIEINREKTTDDNYSMTTPDPPLLYKSLREMAEAGCDAIIMEVSSHALALDKLAPLNFDIGVFTNLSPEHIDFHGDIEGYFKAKTKLFDLCELMIFNNDDKYARRAYERCQKRKISAGILWQGDVWASKVQSRGFSGLEYTYHSNGFSFKMKLPLPGLYNAYNSMLASAVCIEMGCKPCQVKEIMNKMPPVPGRYEVIKDSISVIIDYAHTAEAFNSIMNDISKNKGNGNITVVFGCGGNRDKSKRPLMAKIAEKYADRIIVTSDNSRAEDPKDIISDIIRGFENGSYEVREDRAKAIATAITEAKDGDIVAIIGKGAEKYNIDKSGYHPFDEKAIVKTALNKRKEKSLCE